jgi:hypothetical protein
MEPTLKLRLWHSLAAVEEGARRDGRGCLWLMYLEPNEDNRVSPITLDTKGVELGSA